MNIDLGPFCSTDPSRYYLHQPWTRHGFTYATDGRILLRVPARADVPDNPNCPDILARPETFPFNHDNIISLWLPVPSNLPTPRTVTCKHCGGKGVMPPRNVAAALVDPARLTPACPECEGEGTWLEPNGVDLGQQKVSEIYLALIAKELPWPLLAPNAVPIENAIPLKFTGGLGYLMPMRKSQIIR